MILRMTSFHWDFLATLPSPYPVNSLWRVEFMYTLRGGTIWGTPSLYSTFIGGGSFSFTATAYSLVAKWQTLRYQLHFPLHLSCIHLHFVFATDLLWTFLWNSTQWRRPSWFSSCWISIFFLAHRSKCSRYHQSLLLSQWSRYGWNGTFDCLNTFRNGDCALLSPVNESFMSRCGKKNVNWFNVGKAPATDR